MPRLSGPSGVLGEHWSVVGDEWRRRQKTGDVGVLDFVHGEGSQEHGKIARNRARLLVPSGGQMGALVHDFDDEQRLGIPASMADLATEGGARRG